MLVRVTAKDHNVCPYCASHAGPISTITEFEKQWLEDHPDLRDWIVNGTPTPLESHPHCRCQLWQYEPSYSSYSSEDLDRWTCSDEWTRWS